MRFWRLAWAGGFGAMVLAVAPARAQHGADDAQVQRELALEPAQVQSEFWRALVAPEAARADQLVRQGRALLYPALGLGLLLGNEVSFQRRLAVESALARFARAVELAPSHREARLFYGKALAFWELRSDTGAVHGRGPEAIEQLLALRALDPLYEAGEVAFQLGVLHTRAGDYAAATREYEHALALHDDGGDQGTLLGNLAEVTMLQGDLARALALYQRAARTSEGGTRVLALWGSAIALDRLGDQPAALLEARRASAQDRAPLAVLRQSGVFFVPAYEVHYYEGLGALALADAERRPGESLATLLQGGLRWLAAPESLVALTPVERALSALPVTESAGALSGLRARAARAHEVLQRHALPRPAQASEGQASLDRGTTSASETLPSTPPAVALVWTLRALVSFQSYLQSDGGGGPFADHAREHIAGLRRLLTQP
jgi:tetratricopeptide (TPR) repeat protein